MRAGLDRRTKNRLHREFDDAIPAESEAANTVITLRPAAAQTILHYTK